MPKGKVTLRMDFGYEGPVSPKGDTFTLSARAGCPCFHQLCRVKASGYRHTMLDDSDISSTPHARAFVCGALASLVGHAEIYVSGGAEHQGPDGGVPVALIVTKT